METPREERSCRILRICSTGPTAIAMAQVAAVTASADSMVPPRTDSGSPGGARARIERIRGHEHAPRWYLLSRCGQADGNEADRGQPPRAVRLHAARPARGRHRAHG